MPLGMIDAVKPFIDYHENIDGVDFRYVPFILVVTNVIMALKIYSIGIWLYCVVYRSYLC